MDKKVYKKVRVLHGICDESKLNGFLNKFEDNFTSPNFPLIDVVERDDTLWIFMEMPGIELDEFTIYRYDDFLVIEGVRKKKVNLSQIVYLRMERQAFNFRRVVHIDLLNKLKLVSAVLKDGVLTLEFKKNNSECIVEITEE